ncbi:unnamed protein product [Linum tenue]|uniref:Uncharacterized protein n=1 Tax=Linum tenue TaxID=586396 RepID=A0AAV0PWU9_9ROSI|nr:unnamed protein product [Linum tenue]
MERGSDRLALITGELKNFEQTSSMPSAGASLSFNEHSRGSDFLSNNPVSETQQKEAIIAQQIPKAENLDSSHLSRFVTNPNVSNLSSKPQTATTTIGPSSKIPSKRKQTTFFSSRRLNACIIASEVPRAKCSFVISILVLFFHFARSLIGIEDDAQGYRPIYLMALTSVMIVMLRMIHGKGTVIEDAQEEKSGDNAEDKSWRDAFMVLERGLTAYQAIEGLFINCSIYLIVVISGLSLA